MSVITQHTPNIQLQTYTRQILRCQTLPGCLQKKWRGECCTISSTNPQLLTRTKVYKCSQMFPLHNLCSRNPGLPTPVPSHPHYNNAPSPPQLTMVMIMVSPIKHCKKSFSFFKGFLIFQSNTKKRWGTTYRPARLIDASDYYLNFLLIC